MTDALDEFLDNLVSYPPHLDCSSLHEIPFPCDCSMPAVIAALVDVAKAARREHEAFFYIVSRLPEAHAIMETARKANLEKFLRESAGRPRTALEDYLAETERQGEHARRAHADIQEAAKEHAAALGRLAKVAEAR